jgi:RimJ/RimL family protein N-acetyltransferase
VHADVTSEPAPLSAEAPSHGPLEGRSVRLVIFDDRHLGPLAAMLDDPDIQRFTRVPFSPPPTFAEAWLARYRAGRADGTREAFAIEDRSDGSFLGIAVAPSIDAPARTVELGYVIAPAARGRGAATEALRLLVPWAFDGLGARRLELLISLENEASKAVARRAGFVFEGVLRGMHFKDDLWEDTEIWSRLPGDPAPDE